MSRRVSVSPGSVIFAIWLVAVWVLLWGGLTLANVVGGVLVVGTLLVLVPRPAASPDEAAPIIRPLATLSLVVWFSWKLVEANVKVAIEVLRPERSTRIRTAVVAVALPGCPRGIAAAVGNTITLTPGTLTLDIHPEVPTLYIHVLQYSTTEEIRADVYEIERRTVAAVGSAVARAAVAGRVPGNQVEGS